MNPLSFILGLFKSNGKTNIGSIISLISLVVLVLGYFVHKKQMSAAGIEYNNQLAKNAVLVQENSTLSSKYSYQMEQGDLQKLAFDSLQNTTKKIIKDRNEKVSELTTLKLHPPTVMVVETTLVDSALRGKCTTNVDIYQRPYRMTGTFWCGGYSFSLSADPLNLKVVSTYNKWGVTRSYVELDSTNGWIVNNINTVNVPPQGWYRNVKYVFGINPGLLSNSYGVIGGISYKKYGLLPAFDYNSKDKTMQGKLYFTREF